MKKILLNIAIASVASAAYAVDVIVANFAWGPTVVGAPFTVATTVPGFNVAGATLTGVQINLTGVAVVGSAVVQNQEAYSSNISISLLGTHTVRINGIDISNFANVSSGPVPTGPGATSNHGPISAPIGGNAAAGLAGWTPGPINVLISFAGAFGVNTDPQAQTLSNPNLTSQGVGTVTYTYTPSNIPEAETYVAGIAMLGMVGYGFYRRSRKA